MYTQSNKKQKSKSKSVSSDESQNLKNDAATFQFVDNRTESVAQEELQEMTTTTIEKIAGIIEKVGK
jgi:hypothetical protein